jgi:hypothetical protein
MARPAELRRARQREGQADSARQVRGDGRRLRDNIQLAAAEYLVPAAGDRLGGGRDEAEQHVTHAVPRRSRLAGPDQVEGAGTVVQHRRIGQPQRRGHARVALVTG